MKTDRNTLILVGGIAAVLLYVVYKARAGIKETAEAVNPINRDNAFYGGVNAVGDILNDSESDGDFSLGAWLYDLTHAGEDLGIGRVQRE